MRLHNLFQQTLCWIIPPHCLVCLQPVSFGDGVCMDCQSFLRSSAHTRTAGCQRCAAALPVASVCGRCYRHPPHFDEVRFAFRYQSPLVERIRDIKFGGKFEYLESAGLCLARQIERCEPRPELIVPVPLHPQRLRQRGFDQAAEIARVVARRLNIPLARDAMRRIRATKPQTTLTPAERVKNTHAAFRCPRPLKVERLALIDDVLTTGSTCSAAALSLKQAGVTKVSVWVLARA